MNLVRESAQSSIIDNQGANTLQIRIQEMSGRAKELWIATAFFTLDALSLVSESLKECQRVRILFGDDASKSQRNELLSRLRSESDKDLLARRTEDPFLTSLSTVQRLFKEGRIEARCYTANKFHAKAYFAQHETFPYEFGIIGSGNFTNMGLTRNLELNVALTTEQTNQLREWYEARWAEASQDVVTTEIEKEIARQLQLYDPYAIYQKALLAWGQFRQGDLPVTGLTALRKQLDPHQEQGYLRAVKILEREDGVMICDGVGLGKSFIALALMERLCANHKKVLLIAPKSILDSSWKRYLADYLAEFRNPFGSIHEESMTWFGFDFDEDRQDAGDKERVLKQLIQQADVIVIDESHNFRTPSSKRYKNVFKLVKPQNGDPDQRKKVILLTATPVNTSYIDLSAQLALITHDQGTIAGYNVQRLRSGAKELQNQTKGIGEFKSQLSLDWEAYANQQAIRDALESILIQRRRSTCIQLAKAVGKELTFPIRELPTTIRYNLSEEYKQVVQLAEKRFTSVANYLRDMRAYYRKAQEADGEAGDLPKMPTVQDGLTFAAYLPEGYRISGEKNVRDVQTEAFLTGMIFTNVLKQLESSPPAFQGILQSLGEGLTARISYVFGDEGRIHIQPHQEWINTPINQLVVEDLEGDAEEAELADVNGTELDEWLEQAIKSRKLHKKLAEFTPDQYDRQRWLQDIIRDLGHLKEIHDLTLKARQSKDQKLAVAAKELSARLDQQEKIVIFTQSQRTAYYLEHQLKDKFQKYGVARIDSNVDSKYREEILHKFCPNYNPAPKEEFSRSDVNILICTDVLSEGVNMQEARCILNYDIHWNPVRLIQRIGRVDRRLDPAKNPVPHTISILNFVPPKEIEGIIGLVTTVENRRQMIFNALGLDQAFFSANDPEGTLKEFNKQIEGEPSRLDQVNERYIKTIAQPDPAIQKLVEQMPLGAFGVWEGAPANGLFALFEMRPTKDPHDRETLSDFDRKRFAAIIGKPVLCLKTDAATIVDPVDVLELLAQTVPGQRSADPGNPETLKAGLRQLRTAANSAFREIQLPATIQPSLVCWMELRTAL